MFYRGLVGVIALGLACICWYIAYTHNTYLQINNLQIAYSESSNNEIPTTSHLTVRDYKQMDRVEVKGLVQDRYKERLKTLKDFCTKYPEATRSTSKVNFRWYHVRTHKLLVCLNHKAGSTTLERYLMALLTPSLEKLGMEGIKASEWKVRQKLLKCTQEELEAYMKANDTFVFTVVRHPLAHLVSAHSQFLRMKHKVMYEYFNESSTDEPLTPDQIVDRLLRHTEWMHEHLIHFNPHSSNCDLCSPDIKLDAILKLETWNEDMDYISNTLQLEIFSSKIQYNAHEEEKARANVSDYSQVFYSNVTKDKFERIIDFYKMDFDMFGYDPAPYYKYYDQAT